MKARLHSMLPHWTGARPFIKLLHGCIFIFVSFCLQGVGSNAPAASCSGRLLIGRPGGDSDAAFTPSPPIGSSDLATLTLAHQNRIRTLYSNKDGKESLIFSALAHFKMFW